MSHEDMIGDDRPFVATPLDQERVKVQFAEFVDHERTHGFDEELEQLVQKYMTIACDVSNSVEITSDWLRFLCRLSEQARESGKRVVMVDMQPQLRKSADFLAIEDCFEFCNTVEEAWQ